MYKYLLITIFFMAISPYAGKAAAKVAAASAPATFAPATTWPYTLGNAQAQGYTGWAASTPSYGLDWWMNEMGTAAEKAWINLANSNQSTSSSAYQSFNPVKPVVATTPAKTTTPVYTPAPAIKSSVKSYQNFFKTSGGDRATYNASTGYDKLTPVQKRIADNVYNSTTSAEKKKKEEEDKKRIAVGNVSMTALEETPEQEKERLLKETAEATKKNAIKAQEEALLQQNQAEQLNKAEADRAMWELTAEQAKYEWEQTETATKTEENRLNQVRGDIMQSLAARWVDISKLAPEQMVALSGEQGVKAFNDIYIAKENAKNNIKNARDKSLAEIQRLRSNKTISTNAYNAQVASINELTNTKLLDADNAYKNAVVGLIDKKIDTKTAVSGAVLNTLNTLGIPLTAQSVFDKIIKNSKSVGEAYTAIMTSTDPAVQAAYKANEARIAAAAKAASDIEYAKINASSNKDNTSQTISNYIKLADLYYTSDRVKSDYYRDLAEQAQKSAWTTSWTPSSGASSTVPPSTSNWIKDPDPFLKFTGKAN